MNYCGPFSRILDPTQPAVIYTNLDPTVGHPWQSRHFSAVETRAFFTTTASVHCLPLSTTRGSKKLRRWSACLCVVLHLSRCRLQLITQWRTDPPLSTWITPTTYYRASSGESDLYATERSTRADYPTDSSVVSVVVIYEQLNRLHTMSILDTKLPSVGWRVRRRFYSNALLTIDNGCSVVNAAACLVFSTRKSEHVTQLFRELHVHWLKVPERIPVMCSRVSLP